MPVLSSGDRAALLRAQLSGASGEAHAVGGLGEHPVANVLVGTALHAAARFELGLRLTELEQRLTDQLTALLGEDTVEEFGRIYREPATQAAIRALFPPVVAERPLGEGINAEHLHEWAVSARKEITALPSMRQLTVRQLGEGAFTGGEEAVVVTAPPVPGSFMGEVGAGTAYEVRIRLVKFRCDREPDGAGKAGVFWGAGAGSDLHAQTVVLTPEPFEVQTGTVKDFAPGVHLFKGPARAFVAGHLQCWQPGDSAGPHHAEARRFLTDAARHCAATALQLASGSPEALAGWTAAVARLARWAFGLSGQGPTAHKMVAFSRDALVDLARTGDSRTKTVLEAGGVGRYTLTLETTLAPAPMGALHHTTYYAGSWSTPVAFPHPAATARPSMTVHHDTLFVTFLDPRGNVLLADYDGERWSRPRSVTADGCDQVLVSRHPPAIASFEGSLLLLWIIPHTNVRVTQELRPETARLEGRRTSQQACPGEVSLVVHNGRLHCVTSRGIPRDAWCVLDRYDSITGLWSQMSRVAFSLSPPVAVSFQGRIWILHRTEDDEPGIVSSADGRRWRAETALPGLGTAVGTCAAAVHTGPHIPRERLLATWQAKDSGKLLYSTYGTGTSWHHVDGADRGHHGAALHEHCGSLHILLW